MTKLLYKTCDAKLLQKASAVKFGWLAMGIDGRWFWYSKKPKWYKNLNWWFAPNSFMANIRFLKLSKRSPSFAPRSLIKCTQRGAILLSANKMYHRTWGIISVTTDNNLKKGAR